MKWIKDSVRVFGFGRWISAARVKWLTELFPLLFFLSCFILFFVEFLKLWFETLKLVTKMSTSWFNVSVAQNVGFEFPFRVQAIRFLYAILCDSTYDLGSTDHLNSELSQIFYFHSCYQMGQDMSLTFQRELFVRNNLSFSITRVFFFFFDKHFQVYMAVFGL